MKLFSQAKQFSGAHVAAGRCKLSHSPTPINNKANWSVGDSPTISKANIVSLVLKMNFSSLQACDALRISFTLERLYRPSWNTD